MNIDKSELFWQTIAKLDDNDQLLYILIRTYESELLNLPYYKSGDVYSSPIHEIFSKHILNVKTKNIKTVEIDKVDEDDKVNKSDNKDDKVDKDDKDDKIDKDDKADKEGVLDELEEHFGKWSSPFSSDNSSEESKDDSSQDNSSKEE